jgi:NADH dehydrogenase FAD-containing subunit
MTSLPTSNASRPRVVIVGAGFGGLAAARGLAGVPVDVTIIDRTNHNLFQPLLYQVGTAALATTDIAVPIRGLFSDRPEVTVYMDEVTAVDLDAKVVLTAGNGPHPVRLSGPRDGLCLLMVRARRMGASCARLENAR